MELLRGEVISARSFFGTMEPTKMNVSPIYMDGCAPFSAIALPTYASVSASIVSLQQP